jgi:polyisoprenoid-binding protein YceI
MTTAAATTLAAGQWIVDVENSTATFAVGNLGHTVTGTVPITDGTIEVGRDGLPSGISGSLDLGAIDTGCSRRDKDLRKPRLLDLDRHPVSTFAADRVTAAPAGWSVSGYLSARGTRARIAGDVEVSAQGREATLTARTRLDRRALGIRAPKLLIGYHVDITVTAAIRRAPDPGLPGPARRTCSA